MIEILPNYYHYKNQFLFNPKVERTSPKGFSASKCDTGSWEFLLGNFLEDFFGRNFLEGIVWEEFLGRIFLEEFFGRNSCIVKVRYVNERN